ncbi:MAG TPA: hypothetical protein VF829_00255 [Candidatus Paceibacterota bacterium]
MYDWHTLLGIGASVLLIALTIPYIKSILSAETRPSAVSWSGWALLYAITTAAQASKGIDWSLAIPLIGTFSTASIAIIALRTGRAAWTRIDRYAIATGVAAIILWAITREPLTAIVLSILADLAVTMPTYVKTYREPETEPALLWTLYIIGASLEIFATRQLTIYNLLYPLYVLLTDVLIVLFALRAYLPSRRKLRP